jgi:hypothetical protein
MNRPRLILPLALVVLAVATPARAMGATAATSASGTPTSGGGAIRPGAGAPGVGTSTLATLSRPLTPASGLSAGANRARTTAHHGKSHVSALAIVIAALGALLLLGCAAWALARRRAFEPHWWLALRHSIAEAGYRLSVTWSEFSDWVRLGH